MRRKQEAPATMPDASHRCSLHERERPRRYQTSWTTFVVGTHPKLPRGMGSWPFRGSAAQRFRAQRCRDGLRQISSPRSEGTTTSLLPSNITILKDKQTERDISTAATAEFAVPRVASICYRQSCTTQRWPGAPPTLLTGRLSNSIRTRIKRRCEASSPGFPSPSQGDDQLETWWLKVSLGKPNTFALMPRYVKSCSRALVAAWRFCMSLRTASSRCVCATLRSKKTWSSS